MPVRYNPPRNTPSRVRYQGQRPPNPYQSGQMGARSSPRQYANPNLYRPGASGGSVPSFPDWVRRTGRQIGGARQQLSNNLNRRMEYNYERQPNPMSNPFQVKDQSGLRLNPRMAGTSAGGRTMMQQYMPDNPFQASFYKSTQQQRGPNPFQASFAQTKPQNPLVAKAQAIRSQYGEWLSPIEQYIIRTGNHYAQDTEMNWFTNPNQYTSPGGGGGGGGGGWGGWGDWGGGGGGGGYKPPEQVPEWYMQLGQWRI